MADKTSVEQFLELVPQIISEATQYAGGSEASSEVEGHIRQLKVMTAALMAALQAIKI